MTINIQKCSNVTVTGHHDSKNCKAVYNITTGEIYASGLDAANVLGVTHASVSAALTGRSKTCNGQRLCFVSKMMEHLEEITEMNRIRAAKVAAYDADIGRRNAIAKVEQDIGMWNAKISELRRQLEIAEQHLEESVCELKRLKNDD